MKRTPRFWIYTTVGDFSRRTNTTTGARRAYAAAERYARQVGGGVCVDDRGGAMSRRDLTDLGIID